VDAEELTARGAELEAAGELEQAWECWREAGFAGHEPAMRHLARSLRRDHPDEAQAWRWHGVLAARLRADGDPPRDVTTAAAGLGRLQLAFGLGDRSPVEARAGCAVLAAVGVALAGVLVALVGGLVVGVVLLAIAAAGAVAIAVAWTRTRGRRHVGVWEFERGLVHRDVVGRLVTLPWDAVLVTATAGGFVVEHGGGSVELREADFAPGERSVLARIVARHAPPGKSDTQMS
jgi:hypothetical protein